MSFSAFKTALVRIFILAAAVAGLAVSATAQGRGAGGPPGGGGGMGKMGGGGNFDRPSMSNPSRNIPHAGENPSGLHLGPSGRWWDNKDAAKVIGLNSVQQHRMDDVFTSNRDVLLKCFKNLQHEESQLEKITRARELDENQIFQQIDRVTQARGELEKANAHMLLQIRKELTADQTTKLDEILPVAAQ